MSQVTCPVCRGPAECVHTPASFFGSPGVACRVCCANCDKIPQRRLMKLRLAVEIEKKSVTPPERNKKIILAEDGTQESCPFCGKELEAKT